MSEQEAMKAFEQACDEVLIDAATTILEDLKYIENVLFQQNGDPDLNGEIFALVSSASANDTDSFEEDRLLAIMTGAGPDLYEGLKNESLAVAHSLIKGKIGTLARGGAWMAPNGSDIKPSDHPDKKSCIITCAFVANHIFLIVRLDGSDIHTSIINEQEYMAGKNDGQQRFINAVLDFDFLPTALMQEEPDRYNEILEELNSFKKGEETE